MIYAHQIHVPIKSFQITGARSSNPANRANNYTDSNTRRHPNSQCAKRTVCVAFLLIKQKNAYSLFYIHVKKKIQKKHHGHSMANKKQKITCNTIDDRHIVAAFQL